MNKFYIKTMILYDIWGFLIQGQKLKVQNFEIWVLMCYLAPPKGLFGTCFSPMSKMTL